MGLKWYGPQVIQRVNNETVKRLYQAAMYWETYAKNKVSTPSPPPGDPGQYPGKRKGHLRRNITHEVNKQAKLARVGTNVVYGKYLEIGTSKMKPRPWMSKTNQETLAQIKQIMQRPIE